MGIHRKKIHQESINASFTEAEIKTILLNHVLKEASVTELNYAHRTYLTSSMTSTGSEYSAKVEIQIDLTE